MRLCFVINYFTFRDHKGFAHFHRFAYSSILPLNPEEWKRFLISVEQLRMKTFSVMLFRSISTALGAIKKSCEKSRITCRPDTDLNLLISSAQSERPLSVILPSILKM